MGAVYKTRCIVKRNGKEHNIGTILEDLTAEEIKHGLEHNWLEKVGDVEKPSDNDSSGKQKGGKKSGKKEKEAEATERDQLLEKANELGVTVTDEMTDEEIQQLITEKEAEATQ